MAVLPFFGRFSAIALFVVVPAASLPQNFINPADPVRPGASVAPLDGRSRQAHTGEEAGDAFVLHQQYQAAIEAYAKSDQMSAAIWNKMGISYQMLFDLKNAERCYKESLKLDPDHAAAFNNLATIDDARKDFGGAEKFYRKALKSEPNSARFMKNLATNLLMQHKYAESSEAYAQALALDPHILDHSKGPTAEAQISVKDRGMESYLKARSCARVGLNDCALAQLRLAFDEGSATRTKVASENDFVSLRQTSGYEHLIEEQDQR
jgi:tetratricopeptide (TPR) repeat protein